ncbi:panton-valentine leukocidin chain S precursor [Salmonella phage 41]|nr:panton-valentine leukocidin chain S precursor [Salmonella phage 41]
MYQINQSKPVQQGSKATAKVENEGKHMPNRSNGEVKYTQSYCQREKSVNYGKDQKRRAGNDRKLTRNRSAKLN